MAEKSRDVFKKSPSGDQRQKNLLLDDSCVGLCWYNRKREAERASRGLPPLDDHITRHFREREEKKKEFRRVAI